MGNLLGAKLVPTGTKLEQEPLPPKKEWTLHECIESFY
jgi:hypothetical protein